MNGAPRPTPCPASMSGAFEANAPRQPRPDGRTGSRRPGAPQLASTTPRRKRRSRPAEPPAGERLRPRSGVPPSRPRRCGAVVGDGRGRTRPRSARTRDEPDADAPESRGGWRSTTAILANCRARGRKAGDRLRLATRAVIQLLGDVSITRTRVAAGQRQIGLGDRRAANGMGAQGRDRGRRERLGAARRGRRFRPPAITSAGRNADRSSSSRRSATYTGRDQPPAVVEAVASAGCSRAAAAHPRPRTNLLDGPIRHIWRCAPRAAGSRGLRGSSVQNAASAAGRGRAQSCRSASSLRALDASRDQHPQPAPALLERLLVGRRLVIGSGMPAADVGVQRTAHNTGGVTSACVAPRTASFSSTSGSPADDAGAEVHHLGDAESPPAPQDRLPCRSVRGARAAATERWRERTTTAPSRDGQRQPPRVDASSIQCTPWNRANAISCGSQATAVVRCGSTARANSAGGEASRTDVHVGVD